jgi:hypothetical protein
MADQHSGATDDAPIIEINRAQRDILWDDAAIALSGVDDLANTPTWKHLKLHLEQRRKLAGAMWLLDDLGWLQEDPRERFYLTMPRTTLRWWLIELDEYALSALRDASDALADPLRAFRNWIELGGETLEDCIADARRDADAKLEIHSTCRDLLAQVA